MYLLKGQIACNYL